MRSRIVANSGGTCFCVCDHVSGDRQPTLESGGERDDWMTRQLATEFAVGSNLPLTWGACHCISSRVCGPLGARRLGHLAVLRARARPDGAPELGCVVGPYWPFTALVTLPLILGIETAAAVFLLPRAPGASS